MLRESYNYTYLRKRNPAKQNDPEILYTATFVPVSIGAYLTGWSKQMIRFYYLQAKVRSVQFEVGPILVCLEDLAVLAAEKDNKKYYSAKKQKFNLDTMNSKNEIEKLKDTVERKQKMIKRMNNNRGHNKYKI